MNPAVAAPPAPDPQPPARPTCATCRWWDEHSPRDGEEQEGWCRRYAPRPDFESRVPDDVTGKCAGYPMWPRVSHYDWCGEHAASVPDDVVAMLRTLRAAWMDRPLRDLYLSTRAHNALERGGIQTVGDLTRATELDLMHLKSFGRTCLMEVQAQLSRLGLSINQPPPEAPRG